MQTNDFWMNSDINYTKNIKSLEFWSIKILLIL